MSDGISLDMSEVRSAIADMSMIDERLNSHAAQVIDRGAVNIKNQLREEMGASGSFGHLARSITYELKPGGFGDAGEIVAEIGPTKKYTGQRKAPRRGANIAYFGTSKGGGSVPDPIWALHEEIPRFSKALADVAANAVFSQ